MIGINSKLVKSGFKKEATNKLIFGDKPDEGISVDQKLKSNNTNKPILQQKDEKPIKKKQMAQLLVVL